MKLERYMYRYFNTNHRPLVKLPNMDYEIDAIKYYKKCLDEINITINNEKRRAIKLASSAEYSYKNNAINIVEKYIEVRESGELERILTERKRLNQMNFSVSHSNLDTNDIDDVVDSRYEGGSDDDSVTTDDSRLSAMSGTGKSNTNDVDKHFYRKDYTLTWKEWFHSLLSSPTVFDFYLTLKNGRSLEQSPEESTTFVSSYRDRRHFLSKAFVTFKSYTFATVAKQVVHMQKYGQFEVSEAPDPDDIIWSNMYIPRKKGLMRRIIVEIAVVFLIIVWVAPVTLIALIVSEDALRSYSSKLDEWCDESDFVWTLVDSVQPMALLALMSLLPPILTALGIFEGCVSMSRVQFRTFYRYFNFQVVNVLLVTTIAGSVIDSISDIIQDPSSAFELLSESLPSVGGFFCAYIMLKAFAGLGMEIIRLISATGACLKIVFTSNVTPRDIGKEYIGIVRNMSNPGWLPLAKIYAQDMLVVVLSLVYGNIAPILLSMSLCYFAGASLVYKHQMLYVYDPVFESGGGMWPRLATRFTFGLIVAQCTMIGMMILKESYYPIVVLSVLLVLTSLYFIRDSLLHNHPANILPLEVAASLDISDSKNPKPLTGVDAFLQPAVRADPNETVLVSPEVREFCNI